MLKRILTVWTLAGAASLVFVKTVAIGPVVLTISERRGWGIHTGDALVLLFIVPALVWTVLELRRNQ